MTIIPSNDFQKWIAAAIGCKVKMVGEIELWGLLILIKKLVIEFLRIF
jgi:hypothetical protein